MGKIEIEGSGTDLFSTVKEVSKYGFIAQLGNLIQYLNYRFSYYILNLYIGPADVGVYSVGIVMSEAIWIIAGSVALVQYSRIANVGDTPYAKELTVALSKLSFIITLFIVLIILLIPEGIITFIFGKDFSQVKNVIITLSIGISAFGFTIILSHYFSGIGKYHINTIASFLGLIITVFGNILFTPIYGYYGAGITASLSFITTSIFLIYCFKKYSGVRISSFKPRKEDFDTIVRELENIWKK
jgi:O-antigen/teichoic acid export membrane protein